ncbi:hypothetical protein [Herbaspirillum sp. alder98]|uniref:hypothetical protein n=1 Tax=Herbaspirillum sp. alder98 TaxID=2913096 RepID=UPI001CD8EE59|nr:hypothetical protein [Herbaspirillum sp. alder98]MCA1322878.1 hypothetical protein [Herbaspirillum sp. alder98]
MSYQIPYRYIKVPVCFVFAAPLFLAYLLKWRCRLFPNFSWNVFFLLYRYRVVLRFLAALTGVYVGTTFWLHPGELAHLLMLLLWMAVFLLITTLGYVYENGLVLVFPWYLSNTFGLHLVCSVTYSNAREIKDCYKSLLIKSDEMNALGVSVSTPNETLLLRKSQSQRLDMVALQTVQNSQIEKIASKPINCLSALIYFGLYGENSWNCEKGWRRQLQLLQNVQRHGFIVRFSRSSDPQNLGDTPMEEAEVKKEI